MDTSFSAWLNALAQHQPARGLAVLGAASLIVGPAVIVAALTARSLWRRDATALASILVAGAGTVVALVGNMIATSTWMRPRPYNAHANVHALVTRTTESSFYSDHTVMAVGLAVAALLVSWRWGLVAAGLASGVMVGRVAVGAHYPSDVLAAMLVTVLAIAAILPLRAPLARLLERIPFLRARAAVSEAAAST